MNPADPLLGAALTLAFVLLSLALLLAFARLVLGPGLPDRVVALDLISILAVGWIATYAIATGESSILEAASVVALISFLATVGFAHYIEKRTQRRKEPYRE
jgi:multicomponent Na+:H+ antiporter subunit F